MSTAFWVILVIGVICTATPAYKSYVKNKGNKKEAVRKNVPITICGVVATLALAIAANFLYDAIKVKNTGSENSNNISVSFDSVLEDQSQDNINKDNLNDSAQFISETDRVEESKDYPDEFNDNNINEKNNFIFGGNNTFITGNGNVVNINDNSVNKSTYGEEHWEITRLNKNYDVEIGSDLVFDFAINTPPSQFSTPYIFCGAYLINNKWQYFPSLRVPAEQSHIRLTIDTYKIGLNQGTQKFNFGLFRADDYSEGNAYALFGAFVDFYGDKTPYQGNISLDEVVKYEFLDYYLIQGNKYALDTEKLSLANVTDLDIVSISCLKNLKELSILGSEITNIEPLKSLKKLESLDIHGNNLKDITSIQYMNSLTSLSLGGEQLNGIGTHGILEDISPIKNLKKLKKIIIYDCNVENIDCISQLKMLESVHVFKTKVKDISALSGLNFVEYLYLHRNAINDITPIYNLPNLIHVTLSDNNLTDEQISDFKESHPDCRVVYY